MSEEKLKGLLEELRKLSEEEIKFGDSLFEQGDRSNGHFREGVGRGILKAIHTIEKQIDWTLQGVSLLKKVSKEVLELAREIRNDGSLYIWETAIKEAERIIENRKRIKTVNSYYSKHYWTLRII